MDAAAGSTRTCINLLGPFSVETPDGPVPRLIIASFRQQAILAFIAVNGGRVSRERLASLLWGDKPERRSRQNLRQILLECRRAGIIFIHANSQSVWLDPTLVCVDVDRFLALSRSESPSDWARAASLYSGDLLEGLSINIESFDEWLQAARDRLRLKAAGVFEQLIDARIAEGRFSDAIELAERLVALNSDNEHSRRRMIRLLAAHRGADVAIAYGNRFISQLDTELGADPEPETLRLLDEIRARTPMVDVAAPDDARTFLGAAATLEAERKLITVLVARIHAPMEFLADHDVDETGALLDPVLRLMMETVRRYEGTVSQLLSDGIVAIFGAPLALEDHAVRACHTALSMREAFRDHAEAEPKKTPRICIGMHSGAAVVRAIATDFGTDYGALGQTPQLAARVAEMAAAGEILLTGMSVAAARGRAVTETRAPIRIAGITKPVGLHALLGADEAPPPNGSYRVDHTPLVGRRREMAALQMALDEANDQRGQVVAVFGDPGVGKSRLCWDFIRSSRTRGWRILLGRAFSHAQATPLSTIIDLLRGLFGITPSQNSGAVRAQVREYMLAYGDGLGQAVPPILSLLDVPVDDAVWATLTHATRRRQTLENVTRLLILISRTVPLLILIEDLHWLDSETQVLLDDLVESLSRARVLLLVNYRPEYQHSWCSKPHYRSMFLAPLSSVRSATLLSALLGDDPHVAELKPALIARTEGNPMFLEESVRELVEVGGLTGVQGAYRISGDIGGVGIPPTIQDILAARIDRLKPEDKGLLQAAAAIGREIPVALLRAIAELSATALTDSLARLRAADFLCARTSPEPSDAFRHALVHDVVYAGMVQERRRGLHARLVPIIEQLYAGRLEEQTERLADHAVAGALWRKAMSYLRLAGSRAYARLAFREAKAFFERALTALGHLPASKDCETLAIDLRLDLRLALMALGEQDRIEQILSEARALATNLNDRIRLGRTLTFLATSSMVRGDHEGAIRFAGEATKTDHAGTKSHALAAMGSNTQSLGRHPEATVLFRQAIETVPGPLALERFEFTLLPSIFGHAGLAISLAEMGEFEEATVTAESGLAVAESRGQADANLAYALIGLGRPLLRQGRTADALIVLERCLHVCRAMEHKHYLPVVAPALAATYILDGRAGEAIELLEPIRRTDEELGMRNLHAFTLAVLSEALLITGAEDRAVDMARHALLVARSLRQRGFEAWGLRLLGVIAAHRSSPDPVEAVEWLAKGLSLAGQCGMRPLAAHCHMALGKAYHCTDELALSKNHLALGVAMYQALGMQSWLADSSPADDEGWSRSATVGKSLKRPIVASTTTTSRGSCGNTGLL